MYEFQSIFLLLTRKCLNFREENSIVIFAGLRMIAVHNGIYSILRGNLEAKTTKFAFPVLAL